MNFLEAVIQAREIGYANAVMKRPMHDMDTMMGFKGSTDGKPVLTSFFDPDNYRIEVSAESFLANDWEVVNLKSKIWEPYFKIVEDDGSFVSEYRLIDKKTEFYMDFDSKEEALFKAIVASQALDNELDNLLVGEMRQPAKPRRYTKRKTQA